MIQQISSQPHLSGIDFLWWKPRETSREYVFEVTCDICGRKDRGKWFLGTYCSSPFDMVFLNTGMMKVEFGQYKPDQIHVCQRHTESEIKKRVEVELAKESA